MCGTGGRNVCRDGRTRAVTGRFAIGAGTPLLGNREPGAGQTGCGRQLARTTVECTFNTVNNIPGTTVFIQCDRVCIRCTGRCGRIVVRYRVTRRAHNRKGTGRICAVGIVNLLRGRGD